MCVCQIFLELERERDPISLAFSAKGTPFDHSAREILVALRSSEAQKTTSARDRSKKHTFPAT